MLYTRTDLPALLPRIDEAWSLYAADPRTVPDANGLAPDDYGAFCGTVSVAFELSVDVDRHFLNRAYRHFQNEKNYNGLSAEAAFQAGLRMALEQLCSP